MAAAIRTHRADSFYRSDGAASDPFAKPGLGVNARRTAVQASPDKPVGHARRSTARRRSKPRIEYFKRLREAAAANGQPLPKVTSVLTLNEMAVTGIFKTPRGYAAMVEATPIKLSYTIYPGEKFFDGQLVAVEENRLVFRKVTKMGNGQVRLVGREQAAEKILRSEQIQGTAPVDGENRASAEPSNAPGPQAPQAADATASQPIVSPLDEMNSQLPPVASKDKKKESKKTVKVAKSK